MPATKKWRIAPPLDVTTAIERYPDINPVILHLLAGRGIKPELARAFLEPEYAAHTHDPFLFKNMRTVVEAILGHLKAGHAVTVYGDYDADGVTSTAVMVTTLQRVAKALQSPSAIDAYIPDRITEGYGMNTAAMDAIAAAGTKLVITVDTGIRNAAVVAHAQSLGMDVIVTDHHEAPEDGILPPCPVVNPKVPGETYPFGGLAGCGVAFKVAQAVLRTVAEAVPAAGVALESFEKWLLDLVAIGTIADLMPLVDENRVLVRYGLVVLNKTQRVGLQQLIAVAQSDTGRNGQARTIEAWQVGFQLAPRLNAAGRLNHANNAYKLLVTEDEFEAMTFAQQLDKTNIERQTVTQEIFEAVALTPTLLPAEGEGQRPLEEQKILFAVWPGLTSPPTPLLGKERGVEEPWPAGVMGLVAGKLTERHYRPALAITVKRKKDEGGKEVAEIVGSGRSIPEFDVTAMLEECKEYLVHYGGHKQACGFTVAPPSPPNPPLPQTGEGAKETPLEGFLKKAREVAERELKDIELVPTLEVDAAISLDDVTEELHAVLERLKPYGVDNLQPRFASYGVPVVDVRTMGAEGQHLKIKVQAPNKCAFDCVAFNAPDGWKQLNVGERIDIVYYIDMNEWNGRREVQLKVVDLRQHTD